jgi:putative transposase
MSRIARVVVPNFPHHIIQRGNRRQNVFFRDADKDYYLNLLRKHGRQEGVTYLAYCLMDNHVHLIAVPSTSECLTACLGVIHWKYALAINLREDWKGHLWQDRYLSYPLSEAHLYNAVRYIELNPVRAEIVSRPEDYIWSSARAHIRKKPDKIVSGSACFFDIKDWALFLADPVPETEVKLFKKHAYTGRPLGDDAFIEKLEKITGRMLRENKRGPKPKKWLEQA